MGGASVALETDISGVQAVLSAIIGALAVIGSAWIALKAKHLESKSSKEQTGVTALAEAVKEWKEIAERAEEKAEEALGAAQLATQTAQRAERDTISLVEYLRDTWLGFITGTVPPHLPIPEHLKHLVSPRDFPLPPGMRGRIQRERDD